MAAQDDVETLSYEQARDELVEVVRRLEAGGTTLEEALALWERGEQLATVCERFLAGARLTGRWGRSAVRSVGRRTVAGPGL